MAMTRDDVVAALQRGNGDTLCSQCGLGFYQRPCGPTHAAIWNETAKSLTALADALRKCEIDEPDDSRAPIRWIIPEPKVKP